jgi:hypothetical protein
LEIGRFEKRIALSEKKPPLTEVVKSRGAPFKKRRAKQK